MILAERLAKRFDDLWAVTDFSLEVRPGEVVAVLGPNGAGKTTTVRMLVSILQPTRGRAVVAGYDTSSHGLEVRRRVGVLTEQHGLYLRMPAYDYLDFFGRVYGLDDATRAERIRHWMTYFGLWEARARRIGTYSKGMQQKLALARALLHEPPVLLLDEPTSAMDPESARLVREAIQGLRSEERAILLCTHNLQEAEMLADRIAIMTAGRVAAVGTPRALKDAWLGAPIFAVHLTRSVEGDLPPMPPSVEVVAAQGREVRVRSPRWEEDNPRVAAALMAAGYGIVRFEEEPRRLEEVYLRVMAHEVADGN